MKSENKRKTASPFAGDDKLLFSRLKAADGAAWEYVIKNIIEPCVNVNPRGIRDRMNKWSVKVEDVINAVYTVMMEDDCKVLNAFRFDSSLKTYIFSRTVAAAQSEIRKAEMVIGGKIVDRPDPSKYGDDEKKMSQGEVLESLIKPVDCPRRSEIAEDLELADCLLGRLWKEHPTYALVVLLRDDLEMSSKEVGAILRRGFNNVDQIYKRAHNKFVEYAKQEER